MRSRLTAAQALLLVAVLVVAANLRGPLAAVGPVIGDITADLALTPAAAGLLTGLPILCFALAAPLASGLIGRFGVGISVAVALGLLIAGTVLRSAAGVTAAITGTLLIGLAITAGNIAIPVVTRRDFPLLIAGVTGASTAAMNVGAMATTAFTAPVAASHGWRWGLAVWVVPAVVALVLWLVAGRIRRTRARAAEAAAAGPGTPSAAPAEPPDLEPEPTTPVLRRSFVWALAVVFAIQSFGYYGMSTWLPQVLTDVLDLGAEAAGGAATPFQGAAIVSALAVPVFLARGVPTRVVFLALVAMWLALPVGILGAPGAWAVWVTTAGLAQGGLFTVVMSVVLQRAANVADARRSSAAVQAIGYVLAAAGPSALGAIYGGSGGWGAPMLTLLGMYTVAAFLGAFAMRPPRARAAAPDPIAAR